MGRLFPAQPTAGASRQHDFCLWRAEAGHHPRSWPWFLVGVDAATGCARSVCGVPKQATIHGRGPGFWSVDAATGCARTLQASTEALRTGNNRLRVSCATPTG